MNIPTTTEDKPYIEFKVNKHGKFELSISASWWGGINGGFSTSDDCEGNTCEPKNLKSYIKAFKNKKTKLLEKDIETLQKKLKRLKSEMEHWDL